LATLKAIDAQMKQSGVEYNIKGDKPRDETLLNLELCEQGGKPGWAAFYRSDEDEENSDFSSSSDDDSIATS